MFIIGGGNVFEGRYLSKNYNSKNHSFDQLSLIFLIKING
jgi:hypothetical protein